MKFRTLILLVLIGLMGGFMAFIASKKKADVTADLLEEVTNQPLRVTGTLPNWLSGTLVRNGPVTVTVNGKSPAHWFDGLAMLHAFAFHDGKVTYTNKFLRTDAYRTVFEEGSIAYDGFASDPCRSLFKQVLTYFFPSSQPLLHNTNVNVAKLADAYVALTEVPLPVKFDPQTLDTLGVLQYKDALPKEKCWESAHPHHEADQPYALNYLIKFGRQSFYTLYTVENHPANNGTPERKVIAEVPVSEPSYMHSFALTPHYVILTEFPFVVKPLDLILKKGKAFIKHFNWQPERGTRFTVIDRKQGTVIGQYTTRPFFAFHHANAFEQDDMLHMDIVTYNDSRIVMGEDWYNGPDAVPTDLPNEHPSSQLERFSLSLKSGEITSSVLFSKPVEFPRINETYDGKPYRYLYLAGFSTHPDSQENNKLYKINTATKEVHEWTEEGCSIGEPIFVPAPTLPASGGQEEDDGLILTLILDHTHRDSFLLILDARTFKEIGRARAPHLIPAGLHGQYFS